MCNFHLPLWRKTIGAWNWIERRMNIKVLNHFCEVCNILKLVKLRCLIFVNLKQVLFLVYHIVCYVFKDVLRALCQRCLTIPNEGQWLTIIIQLYLNFIDSTTIVWLKNCGFNIFVLFAIFTLWITSLNKKFVTCFS